MVYLDYIYYIILLWHLYKFTQFNRTEEFMYSSTELKSFINPDKAVSGFIVWLAQYWHWYLMNVCQTATYVHNMCVMVNYTFTAFQMQSYYKYASAQR